jgi:hypothetical protein
VNLFHWPGRDFAWLVVDDEGVWCVPNEPGGWATRKAYPWSQLPTVEHRLPESAARVVGHLLGLPGAQAPSDLDRTVAWLYVGRLAQAGREGERPVLTMLGLSAEQEAAKRAYEQEGEQRRAEKVAAGVAW